MAAIEAATTAEEAQSAVATFKTKVESVATVQPSDGNSDAENSEEDDAQSTGCFSVADGGILASVTLAAAAVMALRKKKED